MNSARKLRAKNQRTVRSTAAEAAVSTPEYELMKNYITISIKSMKRWYYYSVSLKLL